MSIVPPTSSPLNYDFTELKKKLEKGLEKKLDSKKLKKAIQDELEKIKKGEMNDKDKYRAMAYLQEFGKGFLKPDIITANKLTDEQTEGARLLRVHMKHGYVENQAELNTDAMQPYLKEPLQYRGGLNRSLEERYGTLVPELSNEAFSVYSKNGERPTIAFRGSRTSKEDLTTYKDWAYNLHAIHDPANAQKHPSIQAIEDNLERVRTRFGGFKEMLGYSKGGNHALYYGKKEGVPVKAYNPHITLEHDLTGMAEGSQIMRTPLDPATLLLATKDTDENMKITTIPSLEQNYDVLGSHNDNNFWDDTSKRYGYNMFKTKLEANMAMRKLKQELLNTRKAQETLPQGNKRTLTGYLGEVDPNASREQLDEAIRRQTLSNSKKLKRTSRGVRDTEITADPVRPDTTYQDTIIRRTRVPRQAPPRQTTQMTDRPIELQDLPSVPFDTRTLPDVPTRSADLPSVPLRRSDLPSAPTSKRAGKMKVPNRLAPMPEYQVDSAPQQQTNKELIDFLKQNPDQYKKTLQSTIDKFGGDTNQQRIQEIKEFTRKYGIKATRALRYKVASRVSELDNPDEDDLQRIYLEEKQNFTNELTGAGTSGTTPPEAGVQIGPKKQVRFNLPEKTRSFINANGIESITDEEARNLVNGNLDRSDPSMFNSNISQRFANNTPEGQNNILEALDRRIAVSSRNMYNDYAAPMEKSIRGTFRQGFGRGATLIARSGVYRLGSGMLLGTAMSGGLDALEAGLHVKANPYLEQAFNGGVVGGLTEMGSMAMAGEAIRTLSGGLRIGTNILSGGIGLVVGNLATEGIEHLFNKNANPYLKDIVSNVSGAELGFGTGLAVVGGLGALGTATGVLSTAAAADFWNPVGWAAAFGAAATGIGALIAGWFQGNAEAKVKAEEAKEQAEGAYAGEADALRQQYGYMRTFYEEMGMSPSVIAQLNQELIERLKTEDFGSQTDKTGAKGAMTNQEFQDTFTKFLNMYSASTPAYSGRSETGSQALQDTLNNQFIQHQSALSQLAILLNKKGAKVAPPSPQIMDAQTFAETYNKMLNQAPNQAKALGIPAMKIPPDATDPDLTDSVPSKFDSDTTLGYENAILTQAKAQQLGTATPSQYAPTTPVSASQLTSVNQFLASQQSKAKTYIQQVKLAQEKAAALKAAKATGAGGTLKPVTQPPPAKPVPASA